MFSAPIMADPIPATAKQWTLSSTDGSEGFDALKFGEVQVTAPGDSEVLVKSELLLMQVFFFPLAHELASD